MVIYTILVDFDEIPAGTKLFFNKSYQRFETFNRQHWITNKQSSQNPGLITVSRVFTRSKIKRRVIVIPF